MASTVTTISPVTEEVRSALAQIYERSIAAVADPEEEGPLSGSYALAARRRARRGSDPRSPGKASESPFASHLDPPEGEQEGSSEVELGETDQTTRVKKQRRASQATLFCQLEALPSDASCHDSSEGESDDSSGGEPDETFDKNANVRTKRRATCFRNRRASLDSQSELPRLLGVVPAASESPGKISKPQLASRHRTILSCPPDLSEDEADESFDDSSGGELETERRAHVTTNRRASLTTQRKLASVSSEVDGNLPRLLGNFASAAEIPGKLALN